MPGNTFHTSGGVEVIIWKFIQDYSENWGIGNDRGIAVDWFGAEYISNLW